MCNYITRSLRYATPLTEQMYSSWSHNAASYTTLFHGNQLDDLTTTGASVGLVFAIFGIPSAHHCYHNAVHVEPGLTQRCRVGRAQTALQHVEKGLTHRLQNTQEKKREEESVHGSFAREIALAELCDKMLVLRQMTAFWLPLPDASSRGWAESPPRSEGHPGGWRPRRSQASPEATATRETESHRNCPQTKL